MFTKDRCDPRCKFFKLVTIIRTGVDVKAVCDITEGVTASKDSAWRSDARLFESQVLALSKEAMCLAPEQKKI